MPEPRRLSFHDYRKDIRDALKALADTGVDMDSVADAARQLARDIHDAEQTRLRMERLR